MYEQLSLYFCGGYFVFFFMCSISTVYRGVDSVRSAFMLFVCTHRFWGGDALNAHYTQRTRKSAKIGGVPSAGCHRFGPPPHRHRSATLHSHTTTTNVPHSRVRTIDIRTCAL